MSGAVATLPAAAPFDADQALARYEALARAVAEAARTDEVAKIRDSAEALRAYGQIARNREIEIAGAEIRIRAEYRLGELIAAQRETEGLNKGGRPKKAAPTETGFVGNPVSPTLADAGIDKNLAHVARKVHGLGKETFEKNLAAWREEAEAAPGKVPVTLLRGKRKARETDDFYPTPPAIVAALVARWLAPAQTSPPGPVWEPFVGDERFARALEASGRTVIAGDIKTGQDFFKVSAAPATVLASNPPFDRVREVIDHAFAIGVEQMALVLPERLWACQAGRKQFERHRPALWVNLDWREDYLGVGGDADRALGIAIWDRPCADFCKYEIWGRT